MCNSINLIRVHIPMVFSLITVAQLLSQLLTAFILSQKSPISSHFSSTQILQPPDDSPSPQMTTSVPKRLPKSLRLFQFPANLPNLQMLPPDPWMIPLAPKQLLQCPGNSWVYRFAAHINRWNQHVYSHILMPFQNMFQGSPTLGMHLWSILFTAIYPPTVWIHLCWHLDGRSPSKCPMY